MFPSSEQLHPRLLGRSEAILAIQADIECAARSDAKVLITGETGVGKEVVARSIHKSSARASNSLLTLNCAGVPDSLLESELFGHVRGSFTGAYRDKAGFLEMAQGGTVFLDEVGEMTMRMQAVLLRFLETGEIQRLGADRPHTRVNVRLVTATNRDLQAQAVAGAFREDLYFRLNVIRICIPALRDRREDIPLFVEHFVDVCSRHHRVRRVEITPAAMEMMVAYRWPGNIRELKNVIERLVLRATGPIRPADLPAEIANRRAPSSAARVQAAPSAVDELATRMFEHRESFWHAAYPAFMARDLTRSDIRKLVEMGLEQTNGNYRLLVRLFGMEDADYKRFLGFLRKHDCHLPFRNFRLAAVPSSAPTKATVGDREARAV